MNGIEWLFFDIGSTLVDESECYRQRILEMTDGSSVTYDEFYTDMLSYYRTGGKGDKLAARKYGLALPKWKSEYEFLYPNCKECLERLSKKYRLGIIANQIPGTAERLRAFGIAAYFDVIVASAEAGIAKPSPEIFLLALERAACKPEQAVMIGDRLDNDIAPANRIGMTTVRVMQGFGSLSAPACTDEIPNYTVNDLSELNDIF